VPKIITAETPPEGREIKAKAVTTMLDPKPAAIPFPGHEQGCEACLARVTREGQPRIDSEQANACADGEAR
jgi:hypothetical protein